MHLSTTLVEVSCISMVLMFASTGAWFTSNSNSPASNADAVERCFCELKGLIDDCSCSIESIDNVNNARVYPVLTSLLNRDYFRYWKVNLDKECPFWPDDSKCAIRYCSVEQCQVPPGVQVDEKAPADQDCTGEEHLGYLNTTISPESQAGFEVWAAHDSAQDDGFCEPEDDRSPGSSYVDLLTNPERYTGYQGLSAHRVWSSIYKENCFSLVGSSSSGVSSVSSNPFTPLTDSTAVCLEKRTFYRAISGLHASINVHLSAQYLLQDGESFGDGAVWGYNVEEFMRRFDPALTDGEGPTWLKNLYFLYLMELRALAKAGPQLELMQFFTGNEEEDADVRRAVAKLVQVAKSFQHFDESSYFSNGQARLKEEFRQHFRNVTRIMDCVGCEKCKLWGKLQVTGLGTALKILFSGNFEEENDSASLQDVAQLKDLRPTQPPKLKLTRVEVVALVNAVGRLSRSIYELEQFRKLIEKR